MKWLIILSIGVAVGVAAALLWLFRRFL